MNEGIRVSISGGQVSRSERAAITSALSALDRGTVRLRHNGGAAVDDQDDQAATDLLAGEDDSEAPEGGDSVLDDEATVERGLTAHRTCPLCGYRYQSRFTLSERRTIETGSDGRHTLCLDPESDRAYLHGPDPLGK